VTQLKLYKGELESEDLGG